MSVNTSNSILYFSNSDIINNANQLGVSLGSNDSEISNSVNDLLDLEAERALETIRNLEAVKLMNDAEINARGSECSIIFVRILHHPLLNLRKRM